MAFNIGQADLESPSLGGTYSGQVRSCPAAWEGTTCPGLSEGVRRLRIESPKSQAKINRLIKKLEILFKMPILHVVSRFASLEVGKMR
jgi:hypothetical protein